MTEPESEPGTWQLLSKYTACNAACIVGQQWAPTAAGSRSEGLLLCPGQDQQAQALAVRSLIAPPQHRARRMRGDDPQRVAAKRVASSNTTWQH